MTKVVYSAVIAMSLLVSHGASAACRSGANYAGCTGQQGAGVYNKNTGQTKTYNRNTGQTKTYQRQ